MREEIDYDYRAAEKADNNLAVKFFMDVEKDEERSAREGRPIFNDIELVELRVRGDRNNIVHKKVDDNIRRRFRDLYRAFKEGVDVAQTGTPLAMWPIVTRSMSEELKHMGFHTVEQVSEATDSVCQKYAGLLGLKQKAKAYIELSKGSTAPLEAMSAQIEKLTSQLETLARANASLQGQLERLTEKAD